MITDLPTALQDPFLQIGLLIVGTTAMGMFASKLRQPLIPAYILSGVLLGPVLGLVTDSTLIQMLSLWGIAFFLFLIGLEMDLSKLAAVGKITTIGGTLQVLLTFALSFVVLLAWFGVIEAAYLAFVVALSSTMVVVKLLSDRKEIDTLHGRIIVGILLMQDILAIIGLSVLSTFNGNAALSIPKILLVVGAMLAATFFASRYVFPSLFKFAARTHQLLFLLAISTCLVFSLAFHAFGLSIAIGAFLAGLSLAGLPYNIEIIGRIKPLRDFFSTLFFTSLGLSLVVPKLSGILIPLLVLVALTILLKPIVVMLLCLLFGYAKRTAYLSGISLGQISEFSLIVVALGLSVGHLSAQTYAITVLLAMVTIATTSYQLQFEGKLYHFFGRFLDASAFLSSPTPMHYLPEKRTEHEVVLVGYDRIGYNVLKSLQKLGKAFLVIDFNPDVIRELIAKRIPCLYGDIGDPEVLGRINFTKVKLVISTIVQLPDTLSLLRRIRTVNPRAVVFVTANSVADALALYHAGADYVILPHFLGGEYTSLMIEQLSDMKSIVKRRLDHLSELRLRMQLGHEHPHHV